MLDFHIKIVSLTRYLEPSPEQREQFVTETLFWPEISTFGSRLKPARRNQSRLVERLLRQHDATEIHERQIPEDPNLGEIEISLDPPWESEAWRAPVSMHFHLISWEHEGVWVAYVPDLEIEIVSDEAETLEERIVENVRTALLRGGHARNLFTLAILQRTQRLEVGSELLNLYPETPTERWAKSEVEEDEGSELGKVGLKLVPGAMPRAWHYEEPVDRLAQMLTGRRAMSVLLVGPPGVGKTAIVHELVRRKEDFSLGNKSFWTTSGARIVSGMSGFGDWQDRCQKIAREAAEENAILYFGNLAELLETGRAAGNTDNIASFFRPRMIRGELLAIMECSPDQLNAIEKRDPRVLDGVRQLKVEEPEPERAYRILEDVAQALLGGEPDAAALRRIDALHRRYMGYSTYPGKPLRFLRQLLRDQSGKEIALTVEQVNAAFSRDTGLPLSLLEDAIPLDLVKTGTWFRDRLMGQERAVELVVDTIAMIKARLSRPGKPLASFLFVGPTGVGKTELAKCIAEFFYASRERMIRFDMSEYNAPHSATRLVSDLGQAQEGLLTSQMRDQPFSVVLLDEFEKAHPRVFDLFLQVLGEARLTDGAGRVADFSNAIIIMTSNLGAQSFRAGATLGFGGNEQEDTAAEAHFTEEARRRFRPEFFNRIDRIVPFAPLSRETLRDIVTKELRAVQLRDGLRERQLSLILEAPLMDEVLEKGFDPRYGARPLRRQLDLRVLRHVAELLNVSPAWERGELHAGVETVALQREAGPAAKLRKKRSGASSLETVSDLRRKFQHLTRAAFVNELNSERYRLDRAIGHHRRNRDTGEEDMSEIYARKQRIDELLDKLERKADGIFVREEAMLLEQVGQAAEGSRKPRVTSRDYETLLLDLYGAAESAPEEITLVIQAEEASHLFTVAQDYVTVARSLGCDVRLATYDNKPEKKEIDPETERVRPASVGSAEAGTFFNDVLPEGVLALALEIRGGLAGLWFQGEGGGHEFELEEGDGKKKYRVVLHLLEGRLEDAWMEEAQLRLTSFKRVPVHRHYNLMRGTWKDSRTGHQGQGVYAADLLEEIVRSRLLEMAEEAQ